MHLYHNSSWRHNGDENRRRSFDRLHSPQCQVNKEPASAAADLSELMLGAVSECCIREGNLAFLDWLEIRPMVIYTTQSCSKWRISHSCVVYTWILGVCSVLPVS